MKTQFNQSQGSTSRETNKEAIARIFGIKKSQVGYLSTSTPIDSYVILFDKETQTCWYRGDATGTPISWTVNSSTCSIVTNSGSYILNLALSGDSLRDDLKSPSGASLVSLSQGGSVQDAVKYLTPEMFLLQSDGTEGSMVKAAWEYVANNGGTLCITKEYDMGTNRISIPYSSNLKPHCVRGLGKFAGLRFGDIPPSGLGPTQNWTKEPPLIQYIGSSGSSYIPKVSLLDFKINYSAQTNKGGTSLDTLSVTHPTPYSLGVWGVYFMYADSPFIKGVTFEDIYGDGVIIRKSNMPTVRDCNFLDVSAGNILTRYAPQNMSSDSNGGCIFIWACHGGLVENNFCWNRRQYQASVTSIDNGTQIKDTLCGYIGIWSEYGYNQNMPTETPPPFVNTYVSQANIDAGWNFEALGCVIRNNTVYGYTIGIKSEGFNEAHIKDNVVLNTYLPILAANTRGVVDGNWTDMLYCDNRTCPQGGFQSIRSSITAHNFISTFDGARVGLTLSNNKCYCTNYAAVRVNRTAVTVEKNMFRFSRGAAWPFDVNLGSNVNGVIIRDNLFFFDSTISSTITANLQYHIGTQIVGNRFINRSPYLVTLAMRNNCDNLNIQGNTFDGAVYFAMQCKGHLQDNTFIDSATYKGMKIQITSPCVVDCNMFQYELGGTDDNIIIQADNVKFLNNTINTTGSGTTPAGALVSLPGGNKGLILHGNRTLANPGGLPMFSMFGSHFPSIDRNEHIGAALLKIAGSLAAPVHIGYNVCPSLYVTDPTVEWNAVGNLSSSFTPYVGLKMNYLLPAANGKEGLVYTTTGWKSFGSISA